MKIEKLSVDESSLNHIATIGRVEVYANEDLNEEEIMAYIEREQAYKPYQPLTELYLNFIGEEVEIHAEYLVQPFERIRRITGYLVGTLDRFNDAKLAEVSERVKHST